MMDGRMALSEQHAFDQKFIKDLTCYFVFQWWMKIRSIMSILAQHDSTYQVEELDPATMDRSVNINTSFLL